MAQHTPRGKNEAPAIVWDAGAGDFVPVMPQAAPSAPRPPTPPPSHGGAAARSAAVGVLVPTSEQQEDGLMALPPLRFGRGATFTGAFVNGRREGTGIFVGPADGVSGMEAEASRQPPAGHRFEGQWSRGLPHGAGCFTTGEGRMLHDGQWAGGQPHGEGRRSINGGASYDGQWESGRFEGHGCFSGTDGASYVGEWRDGRRHGAGKLADPLRGAVYSGFWERGRQHGSGTFMVTGGGGGGGSGSGSSGSAEDEAGGDVVFVGQFVAGQRSGEGTLECGAASLPPEAAAFGGGGGRGSSACAAGGWRCRYVGQWSRGVRHGCGREELLPPSPLPAACGGAAAAAAAAHGAGAGAGAGAGMGLGAGAAEWAWRAREGQWGAGAALDGDWTVAFANGDHFDGQLVRGVPHGSGTMKFLRAAAAAAAAEGEGGGSGGHEIYTGQWSGGMQSGTGTCVFADGRVYEGAWERGAPSGGMDAVPQSSKLHKLAGELDELLFGPDDDVEKVAAKQERSSSGRS